MIALGPTANDLVTAGLLVVGALFVLLAAVGLYRMPDLYLRTQALTKAATLGLTSIALAVAVRFGSLEAFFTVGLLVAFVYLTAPVAAHVVMRAAYRAGVPLWEGTRIDELEGTPAARSSPARPGRGS